MIFLDHKLQRHLYYAAMSMGVSAEELDEIITWPLRQGAKGKKIIRHSSGHDGHIHVRMKCGTFGADTLILPCDVTKDEDIVRVFSEVTAKFGKLHLLLHSMAFAPKDALEGEFVNTSREAFRIAHDVSAYSLVALARAAAPLMTEGGSIVAMSYYGAEKVVPHYNVMGVAKAALEASTRYLAYDLGPKKIRVNCISAGPMNTLAARGIAGFTDMLKHYEAHAPLKRNVLPEELGATGTFLASDGAAAITGQVIYVDSGYQIMGM
jgi:enoyl-[acyl-carrier protein] reductase I